ncbi:MAG: TetR/AcrR family transcriptional regulator, partial [Pseudohongiella sp.]
MSKKDIRRTEIIAILAGHFLSSGLADTGLRRLAELTGTSDRMLLYYFDNKDELVSAVLAHVGAELAQTLNDVAGPGPLSPAQALEMLWRTARQGEFADHLRLFLDISSLANRGNEPYRTIATQLTGGWIAWMSAMLDYPEHDREALAALILATVDGQVVLVVF